MSQWEIFLQTDIAVLPAIIKVILKFGFLKLDIKVFLICFWWSALISFYRKSGNINFLPILIYSIKPNPVQNQSFQPVRYLSSVLIVYSL